RPDRWRSGEGVQFHRRRDEDGRIIPTSSDGVASRTWHIENRSRQCEPRWRLCHFRLLRVSVAVRSRRFLRTDWLKLNRSLPQIYVPTPTILQREEAWGRFAWGDVPPRKRASFVMSVLLFAVFPFAMIFGALWDLTTMTIPNVLTAALAAAFSPLALLAGFGWQEHGLHVGAGVLMLVVGMALFAFGWIGGGDAKFVAAIALWIGWADLLIYLLVASVLGGALTLFILFFRSLPLPAF